MDIYIRLTLEGEDFLNNQLLSGFVDDFKCKFIPLWKKSKLAAFSLPELLVVLAQKHFARHE